MSLNKLEFLRRRTGAICAKKYAILFGYLGFVRGTMIEVTGTCDGGHYRALRVRRTRPCRRTRDVTDAKVGRVSDRVISK